MNIEFANRVNFQSKKLIPLSEYKGPILKLTQKDKEKIAELTKKKAGFEIELANITDRLEKHTTYITKEHEQLSFVQFRLMQWISTLEGMIREIKINRLAKQNQKLNKTI